MKNKKCPKCNYTKHWAIRRGKLKCTECRHEWLPDKLPLRLIKRQWQKIIRLFMLGLSSNKIVTETKIDKRRILRA